MDGKERKGEKKRAIGVRRWHVAVLFSQKRRREEFDATAANGRNGGACAFPRLRLFPPMTVGH